MDLLEILVQRQAKGAGARARVGWCGWHEGVVAAGARGWLLAGALDLRLFCATLIFSKNILESAKMTQRQRRVYDLRHFCASAKVVQNQRIL